MFYISIKQVGGEERVSTLQLKGALRVLGNLPHDYEFEPASVLDAEDLIDWLQRWAKEKEKGS